jgi:hypothetical protein
MYRRLPQVRPSCVKAWPKIGISASRMHRCAHSRKSRSVRVDGDIRHVLRDLDTGLVRDVGITPANVAEATVTEALSADLRAQQVTVGELHHALAHIGH